jgi:hypothetical protein
MPQVVVSQKSLQQVQRENKKSFHPFVVAGHMGLVHVEVVEVVEVVDEEVGNGAVAVVADYIEEETADVAAAVAAEHTVGCFPESGFPQRRSSAAAAAEEDCDYHLCWLKRRNPVCELHHFRLHRC